MYNGVNPLQKEITMTEPQKTTKLLKGQSATLSNICQFIKKYEHDDDLVSMQNITVEIDGEYYQASLAITKEDDILDAGHLVIKPIL